MKRPGPLLTIGAAAMLLLAGCGGGLSSSDDEESTDGAPLKVGVITGLTGAYTLLGEEQKNGAELAASLLEDMAGDRPLEIIVRDDQLKPEAALREAQSLVQQEDVDFLVGCVSAATTLAVNQVASEAGVPYIGTCQTEQLNRPPNFNPEVTYHLAPAVSQNINAASPWICENIGPKLFLLMPDYAFGIEQDVAYRAAAEASGCTISGGAFFPLGTTDFNPYIPQLESSGADVIVFGGAGRDQVNFLRQADQFGLAESFEIFLNIEDLTFDEELGFDLVQNTFAMAHFYWTIDDPGVQEYVGEYESAYGRPPGGYSVMVYNAIRLIAEQVADGNADPADFRDAVEGLTFSYAQGEQVLRECDHQALSPVYILRGLSAEEAESVGGSAEHGFREIVETVEASDEFAPTCDEVQEPFSAEPPG